MQTNPSPAFPSKAQENAVFIQDIWRIWQTAALNATRQDITANDNEIAKALDSTQDPCVLPVNKLLKLAVQNMARGHVDVLLYDQLLTRFEEKYPGSLPVIAEALAQCVTESPVSVAPDADRFIRNLCPAPRGLAA